MDSEIPTTDPKQQAFFEAIGMGQAKALRELLEEDPQLAKRSNAQGLSPILWAYYNRKPELTSLLTDAGAEVGPFEACAMDARESLVAFLDDDAELLGTRAKDGFSLLHLAAFFGREEIVALLIERGADVNAIANATDGLAPLHAAAAGGSISAAVKLLDAGADPNATQKGGFSALMSAAAQGNQAMANSLLRAGADVHLVAEDGRNALSLAKAAGHSKLVAFLGTK